MVGQPGGLTFLDIQTASQLAEARRQVFLSWAILAPGNLDAEQLSDRMKKEISALTSVIVILSSIPAPAIWSELDKPKFDFNHFDLRFTLYHDLKKRLSAVQGIAETMYIQEQGHITYPGIKRAIRYIITNHPPQPNITEILRYALGDDCLLEKSESVDTSTEHQKPTEPVNDKQIMGQEEHSSEVVKQNEESILALDERRLEIRYQGETIRLSKAPFMIIKYLFDAHQKGILRIHWRTIAREVLRRKDGDSVRLNQYFRVSKLWGKLIMTENGELWLNIYE